MIHFREAGHDDLAAIVALLSDDILGKGREGSDLAPYHAAFDAMHANPNNLQIVGADETGALLACYQITFIWGLSLQGTRRAQVEGVRVASAARGAGLGAQMVDDMRARAIAAGCGLLQLTMNTTRDAAHRFYVAQGFTPSHTGFKMSL